MTETFTTAFGSTFLAVARVFLVVFAAGFLVRRQIITQEQVKALSAVLVRVFLPCLIFANILRNFRPDELPIWWTLPLAAAAMILLGLGLAYLAFIRELPQKRNMLPLAAMQNAGYLALPIGQVLFPDTFDTFALYCFLFILGVSPLLWTVGKFLTTAAHGTRPSWRDLVTPPFVANLLAVALVFLNLHRFVPEPVVDSVALLGSAAVPVANFILGTVLGSIAFTIRPYLADAARTIGIKLILIPLVTIITLKLTALPQAYPLLASFFVLQAACAPATGLIIQVRHYGGDEQKIGSITLLTYSLCILSLPLWLAIWSAANTTP